MLTKPTFVAKRVKSRKSTHLDDVRKTRWLLLNFQQIFLKALIYILLKP